MNVVKGRLFFSRVSVTTDGAYYSLLVFIEISDVHDINSCHHSYPNVYTSSQKSEGEVYCQVVLIRGFHQIKSSNIFSCSSPSCCNHVSMRSNHFNMRLHPMHLIVCIYKQMLLKNKYIYKYIYD